MRVVKSQNRSPILDSILTGGSSVALNLVELGKGMPPEKRLFASTAMNGAIVFKYPNFPEKKLVLERRPWEKDADADRPPIETGIYMPFDTERPRDGGAAIYLRQHKYEQLLRDYLGLDNETEEEKLRHDMRLLKLLDGVPSLDPFLVKDCLDGAGIPCDEEYLRLDPVEVKRIRLLITVKITEIIEKAFSSSGRAVEDKERVIAALWDPSLPEAKEFVAAFGISIDEAPLVFSAWKGITFYQAQLRDIAPKVSEALRWLGSKDVVPHDAVGNRMLLEQTAMHRDRISKALNATIEETRGIMRDYENGHQEFLAGKPGKLVGFLRGARKTYWLLARCLSALNSTVTILSNEVKPSRNNRLFYDEQTHMFQRLEIVLSRRRDAPETL